MTGNTEEIAEAIAKGVREAGVEPVMKSVLDARASELEHYEGLLLGAYTWGDGELPYEFEDFYEEMDRVDLNHKKAAAFGSCDSGYEAYGLAVDMLNEKMEQRGATVVLPGLKIELAPSASEAEECSRFGYLFAQSVLGTG
jgi:flavodoxin I